VGRTLLLWVVFASISGFAAASPPGSSKAAVLDTGFRLKVDAEWVYVNVSVRDSRNRSGMLGLSKEDFLLYEDQILQPVRSCTPAEAPFNLLLLMDVSASTSPFMHILRESALSFARQLRPADRIAIMTFSSRNRSVLPFTNDRGRLKSALRLVKPEDATAFYDALVAALRRLESTSGRKAIVVFSDGVDNQLLNPKDGSETTFAELLNIARQSDCLIYSIFLPPVSGGEESRPAVLKAERQMRTLSSETGGKMYTLRRVEKLSVDYSEIAQDLRFIYTLVYAPSPSVPVGWRTLKVEIKGHPEWTVHARAGYLKKPESQAARQESEGRGQKSE
jgi:Ca-activated chloride channel family protein